MANAQGRRGIRHLPAPHLAEAQGVDVRLGRRIQYVSPLPTRTRDDHDLGALGHIPGSGGRPFTGFVIGVSVDGHQPEGFGHGTSLAHVPSPFTRDQLSPEMQQRYGLDRRPIGRYVAVAVLVLAFVATLVIVGILITRPKANVRLIEWRIVGPSRVDVTYQVDRPAGLDVTCVIRAQDAKRIDVGYALEELPPKSEGDADIHEFSLATLAPAATIEVLGCGTPGEIRVPPPQFPPGVVPPEQPAR